MEKPIDITGREWSDLSKQVDLNKKQIEFNTQKLVRHSKRLEVIEDEQIKLPLSIQKAVENGMAPVLEKVLIHDNKFSELELNKEKEENERLSTILESHKDSKKWFNRALIGVLITSIIGGIISFYIAVFLNNLGG